MREPYRSRTGVTVAILLSIGLLGGCGGTGARNDADDAGGKRLASSLNDYAQQLLQHPEAYYLGTPSPAQQDIMRTIVETGRLSDADYAKAWSNYTACVTDKGYPAPTYVAMTNGIYMEQGLSAPPEHNGDIDYEMAMVEAAKSCGAAEWDLVHTLYMAQAGNPGLYADHAEGAVDCLKRAGLVPQDYTADQYRRETDARSDAEPVDIPLLDQDSPAVQACMAANGYGFTY